MLFNSIEYVVFLPVVVLLYFLMPFRLRWVVLLLASYIFYMAWKAEFILLIILSTAVDYFCGYAMSRHEEKKRRKPYLYLSLLSNLGILISFKYLGFITGNLNEALSIISGSYSLPVKELILPMGISFYTFQTMGYSIDVYQGKIRAEKHFGIFALYVSFFPQLVAGPIERAGHLLKQFREKHFLNLERIKSGLQLILWGLFKKVVIADRLAMFVDAVYNQPENYQGWVIWIATLFFAFQIYCDFSGYTDVAIGTARMLGFDLMLNFDRPYSAKSVAEFWRRWHISLSSWFRDYIYIPLGGNRAVKWRWYYNLMVTFLLSGLWHGASWTFVIWGGLHAFFLILGLVSAPLKEHLNKQAERLNLHWLLNCLLRIQTFGLVVFAWLFFRANSLSDAMMIISRMFEGMYLDLSYIKTSIASVGMSLLDFVLSTFLIIFLLFIDWWRSNEQEFQFLEDKPVALRWGVFYLLIFSIIIFGVDGAKQFIYFQF